MFNVLVIFLMHIIYICNNYNKNFQLCPTQNYFMCPNKEFIQHFRKHKTLNTRSTICHLCGLYFPIWQIEIMKIASSGFICLSCPLFSCSFSYSGFMVLFCFFSLTIPLPPPLSSLYVSFCVSDHLFFSPPFVFVYLSSFLLHQDNPQ